MLELVKDESERIDSRFFEPASGSGNFLVAVLKRKLVTVEARYGRSTFEKGNYALLSLMCIYGIELLEDNAKECRENLAAAFSHYLGLSESEDLYRAAVHVLCLNIVNGDALTMTAAGGDAIVFPEWGYLGKGRFQRRDFRYDNLTQFRAFGKEGMKPGDLGHDKIFEPIKNYPSQALRDSHMAEALVPQDGEKQPEKAQFISLSGRSPDVLTCIANLSNDEVFTPPALANQMLDTVAASWANVNNGESIWSDRSAMFLDPFTKSGVFLREITSRLIEGLQDEIPDLQERVNHILTKQVFGIGITQLTAYIARRSLYCSKFANGAHSIVTTSGEGDGYGKSHGHIWFERLEHSWNDDGKCRYCPATKSTLDRGSDRESHAYALTHTDDVTARVAEILGVDMKFDVIIGNPPYQHINCSLMEGRATYRFTRSS